MRTKFALSLLCQQLTFYLLCESGVDPRTCRGEPEGRLLECTIPHQIGGYDINQPTLPHVVGSSSL